MNVHASKSLRSSKRVLIWAKTYPELSWRYKETVCTAGCDEAGRPIRLYPVPLRYLPQSQQYRLWDWVQAPLKPNEQDFRPESYRLDDSGEIERIGHVGTSDGSWIERRATIWKAPSWHFGCVNDLVAASRVDNRSLGFVRVGQVDDVQLRVRPSEHRQKHDEKLAELKRQGDLFGGDQKDLEFFPYRIEVEWRCAGGNKPCPGHTNIMLDWGLGELGRRDGADAALARMRDLADLSKHDLRFFMGNFKAHPHTFGVIGIWYPKKANLRQRDLFTQ